MDIEQIREEKKKLKAKINEILLAFKDKTSVEVDKIELTKISTLREGVVEYYVEVQCQL